MHVERVGAGNKAGLGRGDAVRREAHAGVAAAAGRDCRVRAQLLLKLLHGAPVLSASRAATGGLAPASIRVRAGVPPAA